MKRYEFNGQSITVPLHKEKYFITAYIKSIEKNKYSVTYLLTDKDTDFHWTIENNIVNCDLSSSRDVSMYITREIEQQNANGYFDSYITKYEEFIRFMDLGVETDENIRKVER